MAIQFTCEFCGEEFRFRDEAAGKLIKCKSCGTSLRVPAGGGAEDDLFDSLPPPRMRSRSIDRGGRRSGSSVSGSTLGPAIALYILGGLWCIWIMISGAVTVIDLAVNGIPQNANNPEAGVYHTIGRVLGFFLFMLTTIIILNGASLLLSVGVV
ncbi:MAG: hypothetical protein ACKV0T_16060 [Planctomycetales bacterium]